MASKLDSAGAARLVVAWLRDQTPESVRHLVTVHPANTGKSEESREDFPGDMGVELKERLVFFGHLAMNNVHVRKIPDICYEAARHSETEVAQ